MANEVTISLSLGINKSGVASSLSHALQRDLTGANQISQVQSLTTDEEAIIFGDLGNVAHLALRNLSADNPVVISLDDQGADILCTLAPGDVAYLPAPSATLYAKASTATADLAVVACET